MAGIRALRYLQLGKELSTSAGTIVPATALWRGTGVLLDAQTPTFPQEDIGYIGGTDRSFVPMLSSTMSMDAVPATYEQLPYILNAGVKGVAGVQDGTAGSGYVYNWPLPTTALLVPYTYTIEGGDNQQGEVMEYGFVTKFVIDGKQKSEVTMQADWEGRQTAKQAKTAGLSIPTVKEVLFGASSLFIDAVSGTIGSTQISNNLLGCQITVTTGWTSRYTGDHLFFNSMVMDGTKLDIEASIIFVHDGSSVTEKDSWRAQTPRQLRWLVTGPALTTAGTEMTKKMQIDIAGKWTKFDKLGEDSGNDIITATFKGRYDATAALYANFKIVNELTTLP